MSNLDIQAEILKRSFTKLKKSNSKVSLRSLAINLNISHVFLSKLVRGKAKIPSKLFEQLASIFKLDEFDRSKLESNLNQFTKQISNSGHTEELSSPKKYVDLPEKMHPFFAQPWCFAILDLLTCEFPFLLNKKTISLMIEAEESEIVHFIDCMLKFNVIEEVNGRLVKTDTLLRIPTRSANQYTQKLYVEAASLTRKQLKNSDKDSFENRLILGYSCAVNPKNIKKAKLILADAVRKCAETLTEGPCTDVFWVQGQMFSVLKK